MINLSNIIKNSDFSLGWITINIIISLIALILSFVTFKNNKKMSQKTLNKKFFDDIFSDYILYNIPKKIWDIDFDRKNIKEHCDELNSIINELIEKSMFYQYFEEDFYKKIIDVLVKIDEKLVQSPTNKSSEKTIEKFKKDLNNLVKDLYKELKNYYSKV